MSRRMLVAGNWKMNCTYTEAVNLAQQLSYACEDWDQIDVCVCPPFTALRGVSNVIDFDRARFKVGAQNVYFEKAGAYTGEISPGMLKDLDCEYCIIGHSERREYLGETDEMVNKKAQALLDEGIIPIVCVGEPVDVYDAGKTHEYVCGQVEAALSGLALTGVQDIVVAYEPIWAIGTGKVPIPEEAQDVCAAIRQSVAKVLGEEQAQKTRVLYGGSVQPANSRLFFDQPDIDGGLIGGAALKADQFADIVKEALNA